MLFDNCLYYQIAKQIALIKAIPQLNETQTSFSEVLVAEGVLLKNELAANLGFRA